MAPQYTVVVFDLDDTLIDTTAVLVPDALARVAAAAQVTVPDLDARGKSIDEVLAPAGPLSARARAAAAAAWYAPDLPPLDPKPGAVAMLRALAPHARLFLLTRGAHARQQAKVDAAGLRAHFEAVIVRPIEAAGSKRDDLTAILERCGIAPAQCLVVGDDVTDELAHATALGCGRCDIANVTFDEIVARVSAGSA